MPNKVYESATVRLIDNTELFITPLKIKYLRDFMTTFEKMEGVQNEDETLDILLECTRIAMRQYYPELKTIEDVEDNVDILSLIHI